MSSGEKYVAGVYLVVFAAVLVYVLIIALKLARLERDVGELAELANRRRVDQRPEAAAPTRLERVPVD